MNTTKRPQKSDGDDILTERRRMGLKPVLWVDVSGCRVKKGIYRKSSCLVVVHNRLRQTAHNAQYNRFRR